jgi:hypothetical protein
VAFDCGLALAAAALLLWRVGVALGRRLAAQPVDVASTTLSTSALEEAEAAVVAAIASAPNFEAALHVAADRLRGECGARRCRVHVVEHGIAPALRELFAQQPGFRALPRELGRDLSPRTRCVRAAQVDIDLPAAAALPVMRDGVVVAVVELEWIEVGFEADALTRLLEAAARALSLTAMREPARSVAQPGQDERRHVSFAVVSNGAHQRLELNSCPC